MQKQLGTDLLCNPFTKGFLVFSGGIKWEDLSEMGQNNNINIREKMQKSKR